MVSPLCGESMANGPERLRSANSLALSWERSKRFREKACPIIRRRVRPSGKKTTSLSAINPGSNRQIHCLKDRIDCWRRHSSSRLAQKDRSSPALSQSEKETQQDLLADPRAPYRFLSLRSSSNRLMVEAILLMSSGLRRKSLTPARQASFSQSMPESMMMGRSRR